MALRLEKIADKTNEAVVLWWDSNTTAVQCPLCAEVELQSIQSKRGKKNWSERLILKALCSPLCVTYKAMFPWHKSLGYEKNWASNRYDTIGLDLSDLHISGSWQPTTFLVDGPPPRARERMTDYKAIGKGLSADFRRKGDKKSYRGKTENENSNSGREIQNLRLRPRIVLGDMQLITSLRLNSKTIEIRAPAATIGNVPMHLPLATITSHHSLQRKTIAIFDRRGSFTPVVAVSGWDDILRCKGNVLRQDFWSVQVHMLCEYVTHELPEHNYDHGIKGRVYGCHAEKQLMAYLMRLHHILDDGFESFEMEKLRAVPPRSRLREYWIGTDQPPCGDCEKLKEKVEAVLNITIHFVLMKKDHGFKEDPKNEDEGGPTTPVKSNSRNFSLLTPPDSRNTRLGKKSRYVKGDKEEDDQDVYNTDSDSDSPCEQLNLRSVNERLRHKDTNASYRRNIYKRVRAASEEEESDYDSEYAPLLSQARRFLPDAKTSKPSVVPIQQSRHHVLTQSYDQSQPITPPRHCKKQPKRPRYPKLSEADIRAAINEVSDSIERQGQGQSEAQHEEDASTDSDVPIAASRRTPKPTPERVLIDLTGDTTEDGDDSEGSCFSP